MDIKKKSTGSASTTKSGNKSGRGRKTKSKEEEEKRQEEEARLRMEQEEKEKKEREKQLEQERKGRQEKVNEIKHRELNSFYDLMSEINMKLESYHKNRREKSKWERYMRCDGSPDPTIPGEINTFLTLWKEDDLSEDFKTSLDNLNLAFRLIDELKFLIEDMTENEQTEKLIERYQNSIRDLEEVTKFKLDQTSHSILLNASHETDPETLNFNFADGNKEIYFCIWANLSHNKRINGFSFTTKDFSFRLPKPLTLAHFNLRCLFTTYDFYTPKSRTYLCRIKDEKFDFDPIPEIKIEKQKEKSDAEDQVDTLPPELKFLMEKTDLSENEDEEKNEQSVNEPITKVEEEETKQVQEPKKSISQDELAILQELSDSFVIDLRNFLPLGPVLHIGLYDIPPQPKKVKQLILTQRDPNETLIPFVYPSLDTNLPTAAWQEFWSKKQENDNLSSTNHAEPNDLGDTISSKKNDLNSTVKSNDLLESTVAGADETLTSDKNFLKSLSTKSNEQLINSMKNEGPLDIKYKLPSTLFFGEAPLLARWDEQKNHWRTDEILDFKYDDDQRAISFKTYHFSPYCLLQDRHVHMPFQLWRMSPREAMDSCMFTIETTNFELNIEIKVRSF
ncbi:unnamed protein product [Brachionus calyciflorus]|uniref:IC97/Casc1 N-terminal domain-containing protein n=1 Tax=Brachionus calyciflorus TaxID=104777 RepID=A0A813Q7G9_9BILA|nr:unnamed protein product [Brachionus calyciflorus]